MLFLICTTQHILLLDTDRETTYRVHSGSGLYYGLGLHRGKVIAACRNRTPSQDDSQREEECGSLLFFNERLALASELRAPFPLRDVHGIAALPDSIWVTCSFDNMVAIFQPETNTWRKWYPAVDPGDRNRDVHHFNTIAKIGDRLALLAHHWGPSQVYFYRYPSLELDSVHALGVQAHNIFDVEGSLATCSSGRGTLESECGWRLRTGNFPRGFAAAGDMRLIGLSQNASRNERNTTDGVVRLFNDAWQFQADYLLCGVGMVLDILSLPPHLVTDDLEPWPHLHVFRQYNPVAPGNCYLPGQPCPDGNDWLEWHAPEGTHRWTASCDAGMTVVLNPGERVLTVDAMNGFPGRYEVEVCLNGTSLGRLSFPAAGAASASFALNGCPPGEARLSFRVDSLWQPARVTGSGDCRFLGISVHAVRLCLDREEP